MWTRASRLDRALVIARAETPRLTARLRQHLPGDPNACPIKIGPGSYPRTGGSQATQQFHCRRGWNAFDAYESRAPTAERICRSLDDGRVLTDEYDSPGHDHELGSRQLTQRHAARLTFVG